MEAATPVEREVAPSGEMVVMTSLSPEEQRDFHHLSQGAGVFPFKLFWALEDSETGEAVSREPRTVRPAAGFKW